MVFLGGPRQAGKTTLARSLEPGAAYLNWDITSHRDQLLRGHLPGNPLWILDEIHKYRGWRGLVKGLFDGRREGQRILVTGSARLDLYRFGGDSLQGRYHFLRLHPLSVGELGLATPEVVAQLLALGPFPEPFFEGSATAARRWSREYRTRLLRDEVAPVERIDDLGKLELLSMALPARVGSPLSVNGLREDLDVAHKTLSRWLDVLERMYGLFRLAPFGSPKLRAVKKERKHYLFDWTPIEHEGPRFENLVACHLLKWVHWLEDTEGRDVELRYFRDTDGREVDFVVVENGRPVLFVEAKSSAREIDPSLRYLKAKFPKVEAVQVVLRGEEWVSPEGIRVVPAHRFLSTLV